MGKGAGSAAPQRKTPRAKEFPAAKGFEPLVRMNVIEPSVDVNAVEALVDAGMLPLPIAPLTDPVTEYARSELKSTVTVCATAADVSWSDPIDAPLGFVLAAAVREAPPIPPLV